MPFVVLNTIYYREYFMNTSILLTTTLLVSSLLVGCDTLQTVGTDAGSISQTRGKATFTMTEAQRKQYERQQDIELREAQIQAAKGQAGRAKRTGMMSEIKGLKDWLSNF
jgi:predicted small secreted protein